MGRVPCHWCRRSITFKQSVLDHEPPLSEGGSIRQAVLSCNYCDKQRTKETSRRSQTKLLSNNLWRKILKAEGGCPL